MNEKKHVLPAFQTMSGVIGNAPIVKLNKIPQSLGVKAEIYAKLEYFNPGGSIKDKIGTYILQKAEEAGLVGPGSTIIEGTSGNTGMGLALYAASKNYKCIFVLNDKQSAEKINNLRNFGAEVVVCPTEVEPEDPRSYYSVSARLAKETPNSYYVNQYHNPWNPEAHEKMTGPEIYEQMQGDFDTFVAGIGTGGTITGTAKFLKPKMPQLKIVAIDPVGSMLAHYHKTKEIIPAHNYVLEGIGEDFIPSTINFDLIDDFVVVEDKESFLMTRRLLKEEGIYAGGSSGAAIIGAIRYAETHPEAKKIVVIIPDSGNRYTGKIYNDEWMRSKGYI